MNNTLAMRIGAFAGFLAVVLGAFGAHGLNDVLARHGTTGHWETAVLYHFIHALMLFLLSMRTPLPRFSWFSFLVGIVVFSGTLYVLAVTNQRWLGAITPIGGVSFLLGWFWLVLFPAPRRTQLQPESGTITRAGSCEGAVR
jgi:uncharacterized membrane protein YgdD (TMEM256/DUF423 family)